MYRPVLVTAPTDTPVSLEEVAAQLRETSEDEDERLEGFIAEAVAYLDGWTGILGRCIFTQTWRQDFDWFNQCLRLPLFPVASIASVEYIDTSDVSQTISASDYALLHDETGAYVRFDADYAFPSVTSENGPRVKVTYVAGEAMPPADIKAAMLLYADMRFDGDDDRDSKWNAFHRLIGKYRRIKF